MSTAKKTVRHSPTPETDPEYQRVGATLAHFREDRGYSQHQFAPRLGISRSYLALIENGRKRLTDELLDKACDLLDIRNPLALKRHDGIPTLKAVAA